MAFVRLSAVLLLVPLLSLVAVPLVVAMAVAALTYRVVCAAVRAVATRVLPRRLTRRIWCTRYGGEEEEGEEEVRRGPAHDRGAGWEGRVPASFIHSASSGPTDIQYFCCFARIKYSSVTIVSWHSPPKLDAFCLCVYLDLCRCC